MVRKYVSRGKPRSALSSKVVDDPLDIPAIKGTCKDPKPHDLEISTPAPDQKVSTSWTPGGRSCEEAIRRFERFSGGDEETSVCMLTVSPMGVRLSQKVPTEGIDQGGPYPPRGPITGVSDRSRRRLLCTFSETDFSPMFEPGGLRVLVTLTYPGDWEEVAPTPRAVSDHLDHFFKRFKRDWGTKPRVFWVREFTKRGAPHFHLYLALPDGRAGEAVRRAYEERLLKFQRGEGGRPRWRRPAGYGLDFSSWARLVWSKIVAHPSLESRSKHREHGVHVQYLDDSDPNELSRMREYFSKTLGSDKSYQLIPPEAWVSAEGKISLGRSWGRRGLKKAVPSVRIPQQVFDRLSRLLRRQDRWVKAWDPDLQQHTQRPALKRERRPRGPVKRVETGEDGVSRPIRRMRKTTTRRGKHKNRGAGFHLTDNGPGLAEDLDRYVDALLQPPTPPELRPPGMRGSATERLRAVPEGTP